MSAIGVFNKNLVCSPRNRYNFGRASAKVNARDEIGEKKTNNGRTMFEAVYVKYKNQKRHQNTPQNNVFCALPTQDTKDI